MVAAAVAVFLGELKKFFPSLDLGRFDTSKNSTKKNMQSSDYPNVRQAHKVSVYDYQSVMRKNAA